MPDSAIYLDNNASTPPHPDVLEAMQAALGTRFGNPSSPHSGGGRGQRLLTEAREQVARLARVDSATVYFTSSGTEANNWALWAALGTGPGPKRVVTTPIEHASVLHMVEHLIGQGVKVQYAPVALSGEVDLEALDALITADTDLVSVHWVNNETGVIQPVEAIAALCQQRGVVFHTDAAQALGKLPRNQASIPADYLSVTAHKLHGPQGVGALIARADAPVPPLFYGGEQEAGRRPGTENLPGIAGFGWAAERRWQNLEAAQQQMAALRDRFEDALFEQVPEVEINGAPHTRIPNTTNLLFRGVDGQALMGRLDQSGILCSQSSACTSSRPEPSHVLRAMGRSEDEAYASVRFSFSELNTATEVDQAVERIAEIVESLRAFAHFEA